MPRDLDAAARDFPVAPDWIWLAWMWSPTGLLRRGDDGAAPVAGIACLASPMVVEGGPVLAADQAEAWLRPLAAAGVYAVSPVMMAQARAECDRPGGDPMAALSLVDHVVVVPVPGWRVCPVVWRLACGALARNMPVTLWAGCEVVTSVARAPDANRLRIEVGHVTFEFCPDAGTFALIAGQALHVRDRAPLFTGHVERGMGTALRRVAHVFDDIEDAQRRKAKP